MGTLPKTVVKRDARQEPFSSQKISNSIHTAFYNIGKQDDQLIDQIVKETLDYLKTTYPANKPLHTADIGSAVEKILVTEQLYEVVREFILARENQRQQFIKKQELGIKDDIGFLDYNGLFILKQRYLHQDSKGNTVETPKKMLQRIAKAIAKGEKTATLRKKWQKKFLELMLSWEFLPGTRILANAGTKKPQLGNCFVFPMEDSIEGIFKSLYQSSLLKKYGGGCGFNYSKLRPAEDSVAGNPGLAAGPVAIMEMFDLPTSIYRQQGKYESGNMAVLNVNHPDILKFIACKEEDGYLPKTNISVGISDKFMRAVKEGKQWELVNPRTGQVTNKIKARTIFDLITTYAHKSAEPGLMFLDRINKDNPTYKKLGPVTATNVCGEIPQYPYEACNLGYLNLTAFVEKDNQGKNTINYDRLAQACQTAMRFMDNAIEVSWYPLKEQRETIKNFRRIGIGVVGWAEVLVDMEIAYGDPQALKLAEKIMKVIKDACWKASLDLGKEKGPFSYVKHSKWAKSKNKPRNVATNTLPPSSGNAVIFGTSFSIEPFFALAFYQNVLGGVRLQNINRKLEQVLKENNIHIDNLFEKVFAQHGSVQKIKGIPRKIKRLFLTAHEVNWKDHLKMQAAWQKYTDNAITKTINMPNSATVDDVAKAYMMAWELGCKGITVYRDQSRQDQVIEFGDDKLKDESSKEEDKGSKKTQLNNKQATIETVDQTKIKAGKPCPECGQTLINSEGCVKCLSCNFSLCKL